MDKQMIVLIADDDVDDRTLFCNAVMDLDPTIHCDSVSDGQEALKYLRDTTLPLPDYVFLDLRMPKLGGKKCLQEIRADDRLKELPVIFYTTSDDVEDSMALVESGATHFVTKPTNPDEIFYLVSMILTEDWTSTISRAAKQ